MLKNDKIVDMLDEYNHFSLFNELFSILNYIPIKKVPFIPFMFDCHLV